MVYTSTWRCSMIRTQIYLTDEQREKLTVIAKKMELNQSELIRRAIDRLIDQTSNVQRKSILMESAGIWKNRDDLPDFRALRSEWDR
jgi:metal-responsive CopG/Arc/MetJ family transcriptional regulator